MKALPKFKLKKEYIVSVQDIKPMTLHLSTGEILNGTSLGHIDHPKFTELRNLLEQEGYIKTERSWWNGDYVLKPFTLNSLVFKIDEKFPCATALNIRSEIKNEKQRIPRTKRIPSE